MPRVRLQDQTLEPMAGPTVYSNAHTSSRDRLSHDRHSQLQRPSLFRRSTSPPYSSHLVSPMSVLSDCSPGLISDRDSAISFESPINRRPSLVHNRSLSTSSVRSHSRNTSTSSIDGSVLDRFGYPTYRNVPLSMASTPASTMATALGHLTPISMSSGPLRTPPSTSRSRGASPATRPSRLSAELLFDPAVELLQTSTLLQYLTTSNPCPSLVRQIVEPVRGQNTHFWYDVRNVCKWTDFSVSTIAAIPGLMGLLQVDIPVSALPSPGRVDLNPETQAQLHDLCTKHHTVKVNAAIKVGQGPVYMAMRSLRPGPTSRQQPEYLSNYQHDTEKTIYGDGRGRVVGIVRCFDQWNSGMRSESPGNKVRYLQGLSDLHRFMREHGCRYGFIMTEIELVCVRYGGEPNGINNIPLFGFLELTAPIQMATHGPRGTTTQTADMDGEGGIRPSKVQMTAALALFYLHMLAKDEPLQGQPGWKLEVGAPAALTRQHHVDRDAWMPKPNQSETREAKRNRGWVWPKDPLSRRECGRSRRHASRGS